MSYKKTIITGTVLLTFSGLISRILGFYNRIFLADLIGAKELGIYSLSLPVYALCFTLVCHGFETGISNLSSRFRAGGNSESTGRLMLSCLAISLSLAVFLSFFLYNSACYFSKYLLKNLSCEELLKISSLALPFVAVKSCIHGFYLGSGKSAVSAASQLIEQIFRVFGIFVLSSTLYQVSASASLAVWGMVCGEAASCIYSIFAYIFTLTKESDSAGSSENLLPFGVILKEFFSYSIPLTVNHFSLTLVSSLEAVLIPFVLIKFYGNQDLALESYGTLTGMAFPFLFFPATVTNSLSVMLLPAISASFKQKKMVQIKYTISKSLHYCIIIGILSAFIFLYYGNMLGEIIFHSTSAGMYIYTFAVLCPFLYTAQTIMSILNGFGLTKLTMFHSLLCMGLRILCIFVLIPKIGVTGYLYSMIISYVFQLILDLFSLLRITLFSFSVEKTLLLPSALAIACGQLSRNLYSYLSAVNSLSPFMAMAASAVVYVSGFLLLQLVIQFLTEDHPLL